MFQIDRLKPQWQFHASGVMDQHATNGSNKAKWYTCLTHYFTQWCAPSVQHEKRPKHSHHVEADVTQKGAGGYSERLDQRHAAGNYCGDKYTSPCGGRKMGQA